MLATVAAGLYVGSRSLDIIEPGTRLRTLAFWDSAAFLLDGLLFLLIGVQVPTILDRIEDADVPTLIGYALLITGVVMGMRLLWMLVVPAVLPSKTSRPERIAIAWSGMRGGVSLAAALAIPIEGFPKRDLVIFVAYAVIVITLVVPGPDARAAAAPRSGMVESEEDRRARRRGAPADHARRRSSASRSSPTTRPSTSSSGCATATARASSASRRASRATRTSRAQSDVAVAGQADGGDDRRRARGAARRCAPSATFPAELLKEIEHELDLDESRLHARIRL